MQIKTINPVFNVNVKTYLEKAHIEIICNSPNSKIFYTLDGSTPTTNSSYIFSGNKINIYGSNTGYSTYSINCFALSSGNNGSTNTYTNSDIVSYSFQIIQNTNYEVTTTSDTTLVQIPPILEPTNDFGAQMYVDLTQFIPLKLQQQDGFMELINLFQDYMNNGFREIPSPTTTITYTGKGDCGLTSTRTHIEYLEPYNHDVSMLISYENDTMNIGSPSGIEQYNRNRDISTFSIDSQLLSDYMNQYSNAYSTGSYFYESYSYYNNVSELLSKENYISFPFTLFVSKLEDNNVTDLQPLNFLTTESSVFSSYSGSLTVYLYFCSVADFNAHFTWIDSFNLEPTFYPTFYNMYDQYNDYNESLLTEATYTSKASLVSALPVDTTRFRISVELSSVSQISTLTSASSPISILFNINNMNDLNSLPNNIPFLAPRFDVIYQWQDPTTFYNYFSSQNNYRIDDKKATILEKIHKIAYLKDADVIDYEYIQFIASQMGYNLEINREDVENNEYYITEYEKEQALRNILKNLPSFYKIKCTKNGLESILLSFGIVGELIYLYTIGNSKQQGYFDFIDASLIEGPDNYGIFDQTLGEKLAQERLVNASLANTVVSDWFPSPHFRVQLDLLAQDLRLDQNKMGLSLITKAIKNTKPINTVFQGFYGTLMANFGYIFVHKPNGMMLAYTTSNYNPGCEITDVWDTRCS